MKDIDIPVTVNYKMGDFVFSMQEIWMVTRPLVEKNKKKYRRKNKHKNKDVHDNTKY